MAAPNLFAYDSTGTVLAMVDGAEILAHSGADESPLWMQACDDRVVGVGATKSEIVTLDAQGRLVWWEAREGKRLATTELGDPAAALAVARDGTCAVALPERVVITRRGEAAHVAELAVATAHALAWSDDGARLAVGTEQGSVKVFEATGGEPVGTADIEETVRSIAWNAAGFWIATAGERVLRIAADGAGSEPITRAGGKSPDLVTCSADGSRFAICLDEITVVVLAYPSRDTVATLGYIERQVVGLAFGPDPWLGVGLDKGDGNKVNLETEAVHRTDTQPGREHHSWLLSAAFDTGKTAEKTPGTGAARDEESAPSPAPTAPTAPTAEASIKGQTLVWIGLIVIGLAVAISRCV